MRTMSLKVLPIYSSKWCIVLQTDSYNSWTIFLLQKDRNWIWHSNGCSHKFKEIPAISCSSWTGHTPFVILLAKMYLNIESDEQGMVIVSTNGLPDPWTYHPIISSYEDTSISYICITSSTKSRGTHPQDWKNCHNCIQVSEEFWHDT